MRTGFLFTHVVPDPVLDVDPMEAQLRRLYGFLQAEAANGIRHSRSSLEDRLKELQCSRQEVRATVHVAIERKHLEEKPLPKDQQHGRRKSYLALAARP